MSFVRFQDKIMRWERRTLPTIRNITTPRYKRLLWAGTVVSSLLLAVCGAHDLSLMAKTPPFETRLPAYPPVQPVREESAVSGLGTVRLESVGKPVNRDRRAFWDYRASLLTNPPESIVIHDWEWDGHQPGEKRKSLPHRLSWRIGGLSESMFRCEVAAASSQTGIASQSFGTSPSVKCAFGSTWIGDSSVTADVSFPREAQTGEVLVGVAQEGEAITFAQVPFPGHPGTRFGARGFAVSETLPPYSRSSEDDLQVSVTLPNLPTDPRTGVPRYAWKVYAVDWWGDAVAATGTSRSAGDKDVVARWHKRAAGSVRYIRLVVAPYHWFHWQKIPLDWQGARTAKPLTFPVPDRGTLLGNGLYGSPQLLLAAGVRNAPSTQIAEPVAGKISVVAGVTSGEGRASRDAAFTTYVPEWLLRKGELDASVYDNYGTETTAPIQTRAWGNDRDGLVCLQWRFPGVTQGEVDTLMLRFAQK